MNIVLTSEAIMAEPEIKCHKCKHHKSSKMKYWYTRHNKSGDKNVYKCLRCGSYTTPDDGFWRMRFIPEIISACIELYYAGISGEEVPETMQKLFGVEVSSVSVYNWIKKYSKMVKELTDRLRPNLSKKWGVDEVYIKVKTRKGYLWLVKDKKKGFIIAKHLSDNRKAGNASKVLRKSKKYGTPHEISHDGYAGYPKRIKKHFPNTRAYKVRGFWDNPNNNSVERTNGEFKHRYKTMRGLKDFDSADTVIDGWVINFNFCKRKRSDKTTPAERCGIKIVPKIMPWLHMIKIAALFLATEFWREFWRFLPFLYSFLGRDYR